MKMLKLVFVLAVVLVLILIPVISHAQGGQKPKEFDTEGFPVEKKGSDKTKESDKTKAAKQKGTETNLKKGGVPDLNAAILKYAKDHINKTIDGSGKTIAPAKGQCGELVIAAFKSAGAKPAHGNGANGSWGAEKRKVTPGHHIRGEALPGDILYLWDAKFPDRGGVQHQHSAIVESVSDGGNVIHVLEQGGGYPVLRGIYRMNTLSQGWVKVFRPEKLPEHPKGKQTKAK
jgi:surface antigen